MQSLNINTQSEYILLIDSSLVENQLGKFKNEFKEIITFDISSDRNFSKNQIPHTTSDDHIDISKLKMIDSACLDLCQWYKNNEFQKLISYEDINIGSLFKIEFHNYLLTLIKNLVILSKLKILYPNSIFICSSKIYKISKIVGLNSKSISHDTSDTKSNWDDLQFTVNDSISLKISKQNYQKLKSFSERLTKRLISNKKTDSQKKNYALIEFDSIKYKELFTESINFHQNLFLYNRHRPLFYNTESLSIIRNSNVIPHTISNNSIKNKQKILDAQKNIFSNLKKILNENEYLKSFFIFDNIEFFDLVKPVIIGIFEKKLLESIYEIEHAKYFLKNNKINCILVLNEANFIDKIMISLAKSFSIKIILLQHGIILDNKLALKHNDILLGVLPTESDYFFTWGNIALEYQKKFNIDSSKIKYVGSPYLDSIFHKNKKNTNSKDILLLATGPREMQLIGHDVNEWKKYESILYEIYNIVKNYNYNLIIKRHPDPAENDFSSEFYEKMKNVKILKKTELSKIMLDSKITLSVGITSSILESQLLGIPVISISSEHDIFGSTEYIKNHCTHVSLSDFKKTFSQIIYQLENSKAMDKNNQNQINDFISNIGTSSKVILKEVDTL